MQPLDAALLHLLADSAVTVESWDPRRHVLLLTVEKDAVSERGAMRFAGVSFIAIAPAFDIEAITSHESVPPELNRLFNEPEGDTVFILHESWGHKYVVVAESLSYEKGVATL